MHTSSNGSQCMGTSCCEVSCEAQCMLWVQDIAAVVLKHKVDGLVVGNTTISRPGAAPARRCPQLPELPPEAAVAPLHS